MSKPIMRRDRVAVLGPVLLLVSMMVHFPNGSPATAAPQPAESPDELSANSAVVSAQVVSRGIDERMYSPTLSGDGRHVAFSSPASHLVTGDSNDMQDVFLRNVLTGHTIRLSIASSAVRINGAVGGESFSPSVSTTGRHVAFLGTRRSTSETIVSDAYVHDSLTGITSLVSGPSAGTDPDGPVTHVNISGRGRHVAFSAYVDDAVAGTVSNGLSVFVVALDASKTVQATATTSNAYSAANATVSDSGRFVAFDSNDPALRPGANGTAVYVKDLETGRVSPVAEGSGVPSISGDGRIVAFESPLPLVPEDHNGRFDVFVRNLETGTIIRVSTSSSGGDADDVSRGAKISADGNRVFFTSSATNLVGVADSTHQSPNVMFVRDLVTGQTSTVSMSLDPPRELP